MIKSPGDVWHCLRFVHRGWRYRLRVERAEVRFLLQQLAAGDVAIDVGAHRGAFTYWMAQRTGPQGKVLAFEPLPDLAAYLRRIRDIYPLPQLTVEQAALSANQGRSTLHVPRHGYRGTASIHAGEQGNGCDHIEVTTYTLDAYLSERQFRPVGFIKCDAEGHELEVFRGARQVLCEDQPALLVECEDHRHGGGQLNRVVSYLAQWNYECFALRPHGLQPLADCGPAMRGIRVGIDGFRNFAFLPRPRRGSGLP